MAQLARSAHLRPNVGVREVQRLLSCTERLGEVPLSHQQGFMGAGALCDAADARAVLMAGQPFQASLLPSITLTLEEFESWSFAPVGAIVCTSP